MHVANTYDDDYYYYIDLAFGNDVIR